MLAFQTSRRLSLERKRRSFDGTEVITTLHNLIELKDWAKIDTFLSDISKSSSLPINIIDDCFLHHACRHRNAPLRTIRRIAKVFPSSLNARDDHGRYPIHVAVMNGCMPDLIAFLIKSNTANVGTQDIYGKTPMHYLGQCYAEKFCATAYSIDEVDNLTSCVVKLLIEAAPESVNMEDEDEMNPIEIALLNDTHIKVVKAMQRASRNDWRIRKKEELKSKDVVHEDTSSSRLSSKLLFNRRGSMHLRIGASTA